MVIQLVNIVSGFILAAPWLREFGLKKHVDTASLALSKFVRPIGVLELVLGILALIQRMGLAYFPIPDFGESYPQAIPAIAIGLIMSAHLFGKYTGILDIIAQLKKHSAWIGMAGIAAGLGSLLFGCPLCV